MLSPIQSPRLKGTGVVGAATGLASAPLDVDESDSSLDPEQALQTVERSPRRKKSLQAIRMTKQRDMEAAGASWDEIVALPFEED